MNDAGQDWSQRRINRIASSLGSRSYLEIGVQAGVTFRQVRIERRVAVDPRIALEIDASARGDTALHEMTSDAYFAQLNLETSFDVVFIDGLHTFEQTYRDLCNVLLHTHNDSVLLIDDTVPLDVYSSLTDEQKALHYRKLAGGNNRAWHGDVYKVVFAIHDFHPGLRYATMTSGNPQTLVWRSRSQPRSPRFASMEAISRCSYFDALDHWALFNERTEEEALGECISEIQSRSARAR